MKSMIEQLCRLPTANLSFYLFGVFAVFSSMLFLHAIKPAYLVSQELRSDHQRLTRLSGKFDLYQLDAEIDELKLQQDAVRELMLTNIPDRKLETSLPSILESLHSVAKDHGLRTQKIQPGEINQNSEIATVSLEIQVQGPYPSLYTWIHNFTQVIDGVSVSDIRAQKNPSTNGNRTVAMNLVIYGR